MSVNFSGKVVATADSATWREHKNNKSLETTRITTYGLLHYSKILLSQKPLLALTALTRNSYIIFQTLDFNIPWSTMSRPLKISNMNCCVSRLVLYVSFLKFSLHWPRLFERGTFLPEAQTMYLNIFFLLGSTFPYTQAYDICFIFCAYLIAELVLILIINFNSSFYTWKIKVITHMFEAVILI